jgi:uracil-DNA glycosylase family 4
MKDGLKRPPTASRTALAALKKTAAARPAKTDWTWESLEKAVLGCMKCPHLVRSRTQVVFGVGNREAELLFVGEAPGADEDAQGEPFVGRAGQLLTKIIEAMGFTRETVFIANVLKCRPDMPAGESGNRKPRGEEMATCLPWLREQIKLVKPRAIVALGATAAVGLLGETRPMRELRGTRPSRRNAKSGRTCSSSSANSGAKSPPSRNAFSHSPPRSRCPLATPSTASSTNSSSAR